MTFHSVSSPPTCVVCLLLASIDPAHFQAGAHRYFRCLRNRAYILYTMELEGCTLGSLSLRPYFRGNTCPLPSLLALKLMIKTSCKRRSRSDESNFSKIRPRVLVH